MIYLDYSATTKASKEVLAFFNDVNEEYFANANSTHKLGTRVKEVIDAASEQILAQLNLKNHEVIYTSGATEANNLAIKGTALKKSYLGNHIITTPYEHSSVTSCFNYLAKKGFIVDVVETDEYGLVDLVALEELITDKTILVSIAAINSETGIKQDIAKIGAFLKKYENIVFHSDMTQAIGKTLIEMKDVDLISMSGHKIYGLKGIGALLKKKQVSLEPVIHGGKSTTAFRAGTPPTPLILSLAFSIRQAYTDFETKLEKISQIHDYLLAKLNVIENIHLNSHQFCIPQIVNVSFIKVEAHEMQKQLMEREIFVSTQTACASDKSFSVTIKRLTGSDLFASTSIRISLSHLTEKSEIDALIQAIKEVA